MTKKTMKAFLIDPEKETVTEVLTDGKFESVYALIGTDCIDHFRWARDGMLWVDDVGLTKGPVHAFKWTGYDYPNPLPGRAVAFGLTEPHGDHCSPNISLEEFTKHVEFLGLIDPTVTPIQDGNRLELRIDYKKIETAT